MENNSMEEILSVVNKIIKCSFLKESDLLFLSYFSDDRFEIFIRPAIIGNDFIRYCLVKGIRFGVIIIRYSKVKEYNGAIERAKKFYEYAKKNNIEISDFFILRNNVFRNQTDSIIKDDT